MWTHCKDGTTCTMCSLTFTLFWSRKTSVIIETFQLSSRVFVCALLSRDLFIFLVRVSFFFSYFLCYPYFGTFFFTWSLLIHSLIYIPISSLMLFFNSIYKNWTISHKTNEHHSTFLVLNSSTNHISFFLRSSGQCTFYTSSNTPLELYHMSTYMKYISYNFCCFQCFLKFLFFSPYKGSEWRTEYHLTMIHF